MWCQLILDTTYINNYSVEFPTTRTDSLLRITQWQYWWWFWFTYFLVFYYFLLLRLFRFRTLKFRPKIATTTRSHGKWGDLIVCLLPLSWCANILTNSNLILRLLEWQSESSLFTIRIRGKQWYWVYKFELKTITDILSAPKNIGHNKWFISLFNDLKVADDYLHIMQLRSQNNWTRFYWNSIFERNLKEPNFYVSSPQEMLIYDYSNIIKKNKFKQIKNPKIRSKYLLNERPYIQEPSSIYFNSARRIYSWMLASFDLTKPRINVDSIYLHQIKLRYRIKFFCKACFDTSSPKSIIWFNRPIVETYDLPRNSNFFKKINYKFSKFFLKILPGNNTYLNKNAAQKILKKNNSSILNINNYDYLDVNRWLKFSDEIQSPIRLIKTPLKYSNFNDQSFKINSKFKLFRLKYNDSTDLLQHKPLPHNTYLIYKQKRYQRKDKFIPKNKNFYQDYNLTITKPINFLINTEINELIKFKINLLNNFLEKKNKFIASKKYYFFSLKKQFNFIEPNFKLSFKNKISLNEFNDFLYQYPVSFENFKIVYNRATSLFKDKFGFNQLKSNFFYNNKIIVIPFNFNNQTKKNIISNFILFKFSVVKFFYDYLNYKNNIKLLEQKKIKFNIFFKKVPFNFKNISLESLQMKYKSLNLMLPSHKNSNSKALDYKTYISELLYYKSWNKKILSNKTLWKNLVTKYFNKIYIDNLKSINKKNLFKLIDNINSSKKKIINLDTNTKLLFNQIKPYLKNINNENYIFINNLKIKNISELNDIFFNLQNNSINFNKKPIFSALREYFYLLNNDGSSKKLICLDKNNIRWYRDFFVNVKKNPLTNRLGQKLLFNKVTQYFSNKSIADQFCLNLLINKTFLKNLNITNYSKLDLNFFKNYNYHNNLLYNNYSLFLELLKQKEQIDIQFFKNLNNYKSNFLKIFDIILNNNRINKKKINIFKSVSLIKPETQNKFNKLLSLKKFKTQFELNGTNYGISLRYQPRQTIDLFNFRKLTNFNIRCLKMIKFTWCNNIQSYETYYDPLIRRFLYDAPIIKNHNQFGYHNKIKNIDFVISSLSKNILKNIEIEIQKMELKNKQLKNLELKNLELENKYSNKIETERIFPKTIKKNSTQQKQFNIYLFGNQLIVDNLNDSFINYRFIQKNKNISENASNILNRRLLRTKRTLVLPVNINVTVITNSYDVVHSWFIPGLGLKLDCIPGRSTHHTLNIENVGFYYGQCAEICGRYHHHMPIRICALPFEHFLVWWHTFGLPKMLNLNSKFKNLHLYSKKKYTW